MSQIDYKKQVLAFCAIVMGTIVVYIVTLLLCVHILHLPTLNAEIWLDNVYKIKDYINAKSSNKQRLIIISGSNSLFGFDSSLIDKHTKYQPINYATHAGLPINYHIDKIIENARKGDIVIMPLEFEYYTRNAPKDDIWYIRNMLIWGNGYMKYISIKGILLTYFSTNPNSVIKDIFSFIKNNQNTFEQNPIDEMKNTWEQNLAKNEPCSSHNMYHYSGLSPYGDFCGQENTELFVGETNYGLQSNLKVSQFFIDEFKRLNTFAKNNEIKVFLTYPTSIENKLFSTNNPKTFEIIENLKMQLAKNGIAIYGDFRDFHFEQKYFFDTTYHLNRQGVILRTQNFIKFLNTLEKMGKI